MLGYNDADTMSFPPNTSDSEKRALLIAAIKEGNEAYINPDFNEKQSKDIRKQIAIYKQQLAELDGEQKPQRPNQKSGLEGIFDVGEEFDISDIKFM